MKMNHIHTQLRVRGERHKIAQLGRVVIKLKPCMPSRVLEALTCLAINDIIFLRGALAVTHDLTKSIDNGTFTRSEITSEEVIGRVVGRKTRPLVGSSKLQRTDSRW
jgi:hypothetical protein